MISNQVKLCTLIYGFVLKISHGCIQFCKLAGSLLYMEHFIFCVLKRELVFVFPVQTVTGQM